MRVRVALALAAVTLVPLIVPAAAEGAVGGPRVTGLSPDSGPIAGGDLVKVRGEGFHDVRRVLFGGEESPFVVLSARRILVSAPSRTEPGRVQVRVQTDTGWSPAHHASSYRYLPPPRVDEVSPNQGPNVGGNRLMITGDGFTDARRVEIGRRKATFRVVSDSEIRAVAPVGWGQVGVTVVTPGGTRHPGGKHDYRYIRRPLIESIDPVTAPIDGGDTLTIIGKRLGIVDAVTFGGVPANGHHAVSSTQLRAVVPPHEAGKIHVRLHSTGGWSATNPLTAFTFIAPPPPPTIDSVLPGSGPTTGLTQVTIAGTGFFGVTDVKFGGTSAFGFTVDSDTQISATTPPGSVGPVTVTVESDHGESEPDGTFTYVAPPTPPSISGVSPEEGPSAGGTIVTISGNNFTGASQVTFDGTPSPDFTVDSNNQITATTPAGGPGVVDVRVTTPQGTSPTSSFAEFTYL